MKLYYDNKAAILIAHNLVLHNRTKHVEVDKHLIKEKLENWLICMLYIPTNKQVVDMLSKGIPTKQFDRLIGKLAMEDIFKPTWGRVLKKIGSTKIISKILGDLNVQDVRRFILL